MALLSEYGGIKPSIITYQPYTQTIETISGLLLLYPITEQEPIRDGIIFHFFKKTFWGKKQLGYLKMEYIPGKHTDTSLKVDNDGNILPPYTDIVIGVQYGSEFNSVQWTEQSKIFTLNSPEKQVLSLGFLFQNIDFQVNITRQLQAEEFNSAGDIMMLNVNRLGYFSKNIELLDRVKNTLKAFDKFLFQSEYQPVSDEQ